MYPKEKKRKGKGGSLCEKQKKVVVINKKEMGMIL